MSRTLRRIGKKDLNQMLETIERSKKILQREVNLHELFFGSAFQGETKVRLYIWIDNQGDDRRGWHLGQCIQYIYFLT